MKAILRALALGVLNQAVTSGTNFVLGAYLVRQLSPAAFGTYGLGFSALLLALNASEALFMTPGTVAVAQAPADARPAQAKTILAGGALTAAALAFPVGAVSALMFRSGGAEGIPALAAAVALGAFAFVVKEALVRACYALRLEGSALLVNVVFAVVVLGLVMSPGTRAATPSAALLYYGAGGLAASAIGFAVIRALRAAPLHPVRATMAGLFGHGRWYVGSNFAYWLRLQTPVLVATWILGLASVGFLNAGRLLVTPPVLLNPAMGQIALPRLARLAREADGAAKVARGAFAAGLVLAAVSASYCALLWFAFEPVAGLMLGPEHAVPRALVAGWCAFIMALAVRNGFELALKALGLPKAVLGANAVSAAAALPLCAAAGYAYGEVGIALGAAVSELTAIGAMWVARERARAGAAPAALQGDLHA